jgi:hypothetical protein
LVDVSLFVGRAKCGFKVSSFARKLWRTSKAQSLEFGAGRDDEDDDDEHDETERETM